VNPVLLIGGSDSSGGAGVQRDLVTLTELQVPALCALTAVTAQTDAAVLAVQVLPETLVRAQLEAAFAGARPGAVKSGMLAAATTVRAVAEVLEREAEVPFVLDPVLRATSGAALLSEAGRESLVKRLLPRATVLTPNVAEAAALLGARPAGSEDALLEQGSSLLALGARAVLLKGGHLGGAESTDWLLEASGERTRLSAPRSARDMRGTGCALASAIAAYLAAGTPLAEACARAKQYLTARLQAGR